MNTACLITSRSAAGFAAHVARVAADGDPDRMLPALRTIWRWTFDGDTTTFTQHLLRHDWAHLDPHTYTITDGGAATAGVGVYADPPDAGTATRSDARPGTTGTAWLYVIDAFDEHVVVFFRHHIRDVGATQPPPAPHGRGRLLLAAAAVAGVPIVGHVFPLRADITIRLSLPTNLTAAEADRLTGFIRSLVI
jgi:hypothetical protein